MIIAILGIVVGMTLLIFGSDLLVKGAINIAKKFNISNFTIGLTVVSFGTSAPELFISVKAALSSNHGIAVGSIIGSNISNILLGLGIASLVTPIAINTKEVLEDALVMLIVTGTLYLFAKDLTLAKYEGVLLTIFLCSHLLYQIFKNKGKTPNQNLNSEVLTGDFVSSILFVATGIGMLFYGSKIMVNSSVEISELLMTSESVIGLTIVALSSSLPEIVTCIIASKNKYTNVVLGNVIGSNIFNIVGVLGISAVIVPLQMEQSLLQNDLIITLIVSLLLFLIIAFKNTVGRVLGVVLSASYLVYTYLLYN